MKDRIEKALVEISEVLRRHNLVMFGSCFSEGIVGEIAFVHPLDRRIFKLSEEIQTMPTDGGEYYVEVIR